MKGRISSGKTVLREIKVKRSLRIFRFAFSYLSPFIAQQKYIRSNKNWNIIMKNSIKSLLVIGFGIVLSACGSTPQSTVNLPTLTTGPDDTLKVALVYNKPEDKATTHIFGANCLLCYGVASALTSTLDKHLESRIDTSELDSIADLIVEKYQSRYASVERVEMTTKEIDKLEKFKGGLGFAIRDFRGLKEKS